MTKPSFGAAEVVEIASKIAQDDALYLVGGQATYLWAWFYRDRLNPKLVALTSEDIDYFGSRSAAENLAKALSGCAVFANFDDATPNAAIVKAVVNGKPLQIDIMRALLGVSPSELAKSISSISVAADVDGKEVEARIQVMHPLACFKSRVANILHPATKRTDELSRLQLNASLAVLEAYIDDTIDDGDTKEYHLTLRDLEHYLSKDRFGKRSHQETPADALAIIARFASDPRVSELYRTRTLLRSVERIEVRRRKRAKRGL